MSMMLDLGIVKKDFTSLMGNIHPWMLSHFVMPVFLQTLLSHSIFMSVNYGVVLYVAPHPPFFTTSMHRPNNLSEIKLGYMI
jgi:hypothetical protein